MKFNIENIFYYIKYIFYIFLFISIFGLSRYAPTYLDELRVFIKLFICIFLIYRFNPFSNSTFTEFDKIIVFDSAIYLLSSSLIISAIEIIQHKYIYLKEKKTKNKENN